MKNKTDVRVRKTQHKLKQAIQDLVLKQEYQELTVLQIVEHANVGHKTFYRHFPDKRALVLAVITDIFQELMQLQDTTHSIEAVENNARHLLKIIDQHSTFIQAVREEIVLQELAHQLQPVGTAEVALILSLRPKSIETSNMPPSELMGYHFVSGILQLVDWWIQHDKPYSIEQMSDYINYLVVRPLWRG